jgi:hypothetical protein
MDTCRFFNCADIDYRQILKTEVSSQFLVIIDVLYVIQNKTSIFFPLGISLVDLSQEIWFINCTLHFEQPIQ